ncbi:hypothetical protein ACI2OX_03675 [Bacillus sp. N9]
MANNAELVEKLIDFQAGIHALNTDGTTAPLLAIEEDLKMYY